MLSIYMLTLFRTAWRSQLDNSLQDNGIHSPACPMRQSHVWVSYHPSRKMVGPIEVFPGEGNANDHQCDELSL